MRKSLIIFIYLIANFSAIFAQSVNDELFYVYHKDGTYNTFLYSEIDSIVLTHYDEDSIYHEQIQAQIFHTKDSIYQIPLQNIKDVSFIACHEVDIETPLYIEKSIDNILKDCNSIEETSAYCKQIESIEGVKTAWISANSLYVKLINGETKFWMFPPKDEINADSLLFSSQEYSLQIPPLNEYNTEREYLHNNSDSLLFSNQEYSQQIQPLNEDNAEREYLHKKKLCIINQQYNDETRNIFKEKYNILKDEYSHKGIDVDMINGENFTLDFLSRKILDYNLIFLITHGNSEGFILTGENYYSDDKDIMRLREALAIKGYIMDGSIKELRNGQDTLIHYVAISPKFISSKTKGRYDDAILFNTACYSTFKQELAQSFIIKGVRSYLGYNNENSVGKIAGGLFYYNMLWGSSVIEAFNEIPTEEKEESRYGASLQVMGYGDNLCFHLCPDENHPHMIDLGLPSGVKWSCCNVQKDIESISQTMPEKFGGYFAWGETHEKDIYKLDNYEYYVDGEYIDIGEEDKTADGKTAHYVISGTEYDVASKKWGKRWVMPTVLDARELVDNCKSKYKTAYGTNGVFITGPNKKSIFFPAAGNYANGYPLMLQNRFGYYHLGTQCNYADNKSQVYTLLFYTLEYESGRKSHRFGYAVQDLRYWGDTIRPVSK